MLGKFWGEILWVVSKHQQTSGEHTNHQQDGATNIESQGNVASEQCHSHQRSQEVIKDNEKAVIVLAKTLSSSSILLQLIETISACPDNEMMRC